MDDAYVAGLFDGEGSVGIYRSGGSRGSWYSARLSIVGVHRPMIEAVYQHIGMGLFTTQKRQSLQRTPRGDYGDGARLCKQGWRWMVTSRSEAEAVLRRLLPYLHEKREQVEVVLEFLVGRLSGKEAETRCKAAKRFNFPKGRLG